MPRLLHVVGARPNFMKMAPILRAPSPQPVEHIIVHTGQHYDAAMSDAFFRDLALPAPDVNLGVGSGSHAAADREDARRSRAGLRSLRSRLDRGLRRRELDARRRTGGTEEGHEGGARRGRRAQLRSHHAGGSQSRIDRPVGRSVPHARCRSRQEPSSRRNSRRAHPYRRQCHGRYPAGTPPGRGKARRSRTDGCGLW